MYNKPLRFYSLMAALLLFANSYSAADEVENRIKAAFLYKFCGYIRWPEHSFSSEDTPIRIGVVGGARLVVDIADTVMNRSVNGRAFEVRRIRSSDKIDDIHVLYIGRDTRATVEHFLTPDSVRPILTVADNGKSSTLNIIEFVLVDQRVRFNISNQRAEAVGLKVSSQLLSIAMQVKDGVRR